MHRFTDPDVKLRAVRVQLVEGGGGASLRRGATEVHVAGAGAAAAVEGVLAAFAGRPATPDEVCELFAEPSRGPVRDLIDELARRRILVPADDEAGPRTDQVESPLEVFYWQFGVKPDEVTKSLSDARVTVLGVNDVSRQMVQTLRAAGLADVTVVDFKLLRNQSLFDDEERVGRAWPADLPPVAFDVWKSALEAESPSCIVATSDSGTRSALRDWNRYCVEERCLFLPVVLRDYTGSVGPLVLPGESACYECAVAREWANEPAPAVARELEEAQARVVPVPAFHPAMASILGDFAAMELVKYFLAIPMEWVGTVFDVNLLQPSLRRRKILKVPRCSVCSNLNHRPSHTVDKDDFMHERQ